MQEANKDKTDQISVEALNQVLQQDKYRKP